MPSGDRGLETAAAPLVDSDKDVLSIRSQVRVLVDPARSEGFPDGVLRLVGHGRGLPGWMDRARRRGGVRARL